MKTYLKFASFILCLALISACSKSGSDKNTVWIYTSMYKDTIADLKPKLKEAFPDIEVKWFQAGSENIASKVNAEILSDNLQADILISSDRFWYEELAQKKLVIPYTHPAADKISPELKHPDNMYHVLSIPVMVLCYNSDSIKDAPNTYKDLALNKWSGKITTGSPLESGTNFTTMAVLQNKYGWDYFKSLKSNKVISQGGNSSVLRRIQSGERPIGWVLLENVLRLQKKDKRLKIVYPDDGVVTHSNVMAITNKEAKQHENAKKVAQWLFKDQGQAAMTRSFMYSPLPNIAAPVGAPELKIILEKSFPWTRELISKLTKQRTELKEKYTELMF